MSVNLSPVAGAAAQFLDNAGNVLTGGKLFTYLAGTTTPAAVYTDSTGTTFHANPIILDASGRVSAGGEVWITTGTQYKFVLEDANNVLIATWDNVPGATNINAADVVFTGFKGQVGVVQDLADDDGADWIGFESAGTGVVARSAQDKMRDMVSVKDYGAVGDGVADDTVAFQALATECEVGKATYFYVPNFNENYYIDDKITFNEPGEKVFGFAGGTYNRGTGKNGKILIGPNAPYAFDFGNERTTGNPADNWSIANIAFLQATGVAART